MKDYDYDYDYSMHTEKKIIKKAYCKVLFIEKNFSVSKQQEAYDIKNRIVCTSSRVFVIN